MLGIIKTLHSYTKILGLWLSGQKILPEDYSRDYDKTAPTYNRWLTLMGPHTDKILTAADPFSGREARFLDFCCGTGYITEKLLKTRPEEKNWRIKATDISAGMVEEARRRIKDKRADFFVEEGSDFLKRCRESFDTIFCGWALVYFSPVQIIRMMREHLNKTGTIALIMNAKGTLKGVEESFLEIMKEYPKAFGKIMDIRFSLPHGEKELISWFRSGGFIPLITGSGEEEVIFDTPDELLDWLQETGAIAGTSTILKDKDFARKILTEKFRKRLFNQGKYRVNHKFVYGIFRLKGGTQS